ncbi:MAG: deoxyribonuclease V [Sedimenticola sp.]
MFEKLHPWDVSPREAREIQQQLRGRVITSDRLGKVRHVAGVDVGFEENGRITRAAVVLLSFPGLQPETSAIARRPTGFPYVPGLLSFREIPAVLDALEKLERLPDLLLCDGQGIAHPRRFGIACHLGLLTDIPAIGVAKSRLTGTHGELPPGKGSWVPLMDGEERIGAVLRSRSNVSPLYISPGHKISLETAIDYVLACTPKYRLPETTRRAHRLASG